MHDWIIENADNTLSCTAEGALCLMIASARSGDTRHKQWLLSRLQGSQRRRLERMITRHNTPNNDLMNRALADLLPVTSLEEIEAAW